jgi:hypothetical protein
MQSWLVKRIIQGRKQGRLHLGMKAIPPMYVGTYKMKTGGLIREARLIGIRRAVQISFHLLPSRNPDFGSGRSCHPLDVYHSKF